MGRSEETAGSRLPSWHDEGVLKTWPATPVEASLTQARGFGLNLSELLLLEKGAAGVEQPSENIADRRWAIGNAYDV